jgi:hypothetical protein
MNREGNPTLAKKRRAGWVGRVARGLLAVVATLAGLVVAWLAVENVMGRIALRRWDREMRAKGEKVTLEDLGLRPAGPKEERRCALIEAVQALKPLNDSCKLAAYGISSQKFVAPGKVVVLARRPQLADGILILGPGYGEDAEAPRSWQEFAAQVEQGSGTLAALRAAAKEGTWDPNVDWSKGFDAAFVHLDPTRNAARWLSSAAMSDLHEGRRDAVTANLIAMADMGRAMREEATLIALLVRIAVDSIGMSATWQALQAEGWNVPQLRALQDAWQRAGALDGLSRAFEGERALGRVALERMRRSSDPFAVVRAMNCGGGAAAELPFLERITEWLRGRAWRWGLAWNDELAAGRIMQAYVVAGRTAAPNGDWGHLKGTLKEAEWRWERTSWLQRIRHPLAGVLTPALSRAFLSVFRHEVQREMTVAAIALERFKLKHGAYPERLAELVPEFVPEEPRDFMDGKPLRYRKNADGTFTLWSVGENLVDDGGDPTLIEKRSQYIWWEGKDLVWPAPATEEEIAAAVEKERPKRPVRGPRRGV